LDLGLQTESVAQLCSSDDSHLVPESVKLGQLTLTSELSHTKLNTLQSHPTSSLIEEIKIL